MQVLCCHSLEAGKSEIKVLAGLVPSELREDNVQASLLGLADGYLLPVSALICLLSIPTPEFPTSQLD